MCPRQWEGCSSSQGVIRGQTRLSKLVDAGHLGSKKAAIYHVMNRGDRREPIFQDDADRRTLLRTLAEACLGTSLGIGRLCGGAGVSARNSFEWNSSNK